MLSVVYLQEGAQTDTLLLPLTEGFQLRLNAKLTSPDQGFFFNQLRIGVMQPAAWRLRSISDLHFWDWWFQSGNGEAVPSPNGIYPGWVQTHMRKTCYGMYLVALMLLPLAISGKILLSLFVVNNYDTNYLQACISTNPFHSGRIHRAPHGVSLKTFIIAHCLWPGQDTQAPLNTCFCLWLICLFSKAAAIRKI